MDLKDIGVIMWAGLIWLGIWFIGELGKEI
jgi:hypothetical protein